MQGVRDQPGLPAAKGSFIWDIFLYVCTSPRLPSFWEIEIEALSIWKNFDRQSGMDVDENSCFV